MVSKNQIKLISSLHQKKQRQLHQLFIAEGIKGIQELLDAHFELDHLYTTESDFEKVAPAKKTLVTTADLKKINTSGLIVALDAIRDPGNLGTILRLCDWFGIQQLICSRETVDLYNPKVVQATMGSIARVNVSYVDLNDFITNSKLPVFGTFMEGEIIYTANLPQEGIIVMGNEANGISMELQGIIKNRLTIPRFGSLQKTESLNVAAATAIVLSEFKRATL